jgi:hypothetical protein
MKCDHPPAFLIMLFNESFRNRIHQQASALQRRRLQNLNKKIHAQLFKESAKSNMALRKQAHDKERCDASFMNQNTKLKFSYCWRYCKNRVSTSGAK